MDKAISVRISLAVLLASLGAAQAARLHVSVDGDNSDGLTWATAYTTIATAVANSFDGDTIVVSNGTYALAAAVVVDKAVTVIGTNGAPATIVDGGNATRCFRVNNAAAVLSGLTVTNGYATDGYASGVYMDAGTLEACVINGNSVSGGSGIGVYMAAGQVLNCTLSGNSSGGSPSGGGIYAVDGVISNCVIADNYARNGRGGGAYLVGNSCRLLESAVTGNITLQFGGGIYAGNSSLMLLRNCLVADNLGSRGCGGVYIAGGTLENCTIASNSSNDDTFNGYHPGLYMAAAWW